MFKGSTIMVKIDCNASAIDGKDRKDTKFKLTMQMGDAVCNGENLGRVCL